MNKHIMTPGFLIDIATSDAPSFLAHNYRMALAALGLALEVGRGPAILVAFQAVLLAERALLTWFAGPVDQLGIDAIDDELATLDQVGDDDVGPN